MGDCACTQTNRKAKVMRNILLASVALITLTSAAMANGNDAYILQVGADNSAVQSQTGAENGALAVQLGRSNGSTQNQYGSDNVGLSLQIGKDNTLSA